MTRLETANEKCGNLTPQKKERTNPLESSIIFSWQSVEEAPLYCRHYLNEKQIIWNPFSALTWLSTNPMHLHGLESLSRHLQNCSGQFFTLSSRETSSIDLFPEFRTMMLSFAFNTTPAPTPAYHGSGQKVRVSGAGLGFSLSDEKSLWRRAPRRTQCAYTLFAGKEPCTWMPCRGKGVYSRLKMRLITPDSGTVASLRAFPVRRAVARFPFSSLGVFFFSKSLHTWRVELHGRHQVSFLVLSNFTSFTQLTRMLLFLYWNYVV